MATTSDLFGAAEALLEAGRADQALELGRRLESMGRASAPEAAGIFVDAGYAISDASAIQHGMVLAQRYLTATGDKGDRAARAWFALGSGHLNLYALRHPEASAVAVYLDGDLNSAKNAFREALAAAPEDAAFRASVLASLGDCFDHSGRAIEALECYEQALQVQPGHAQAIANKALGFLSYARLAGEHRGTYLAEAYWLLSRALEVGVDEESATILRDYMRQIRTLFADTQVLDQPPLYAGCHVVASDPLERFAIEFCLQHRLYLSVCTFCQRCDAAVGDSAVIRGMPAERQAVEGRAGRAAFMGLCEHINQLKQDFVTARFLLILSECDQVDLGFADSGVAMLATGGVNLHTIRVQLLKESFKSFYGVLDKIAAFLNEYLGLGAEETRADFRRIWYADWKSRTVHPAVLANENLSLSALFDIHRDFEDGPYQRLRLLRNALTHGFVNITADGSQAESDEPRMSRLELLDRTSELSRVVRNAVLYLMGFVDDEENRKAASPEGAVPTLPAA